MFPFVDNALCFAGYGMVESFLEPHLKNSEADATQTEVGIVFLVVGAAYTVTTLPTGTVQDNLILTVTNSERSVENSYRLQTG